MKDVKAAKRAEKAHPLADSRDARDGLLGQSREVGQGGFGRHASGPQKGSGGRETLQVHLNQLQFDPQGHRHAGNKVLEGAKRAVSTSVGTHQMQRPNNADLMPKAKKTVPEENVRILNPAVQF